jgi:exosortase F-associated protein
VFKDSELVKFSSVLYLIFFLILIMAFFSVMYVFGEKNNLALFYIRRFIIQPLFVVLFVPAFYYQARMAKK